MKVFVEFVEGVFFVDLKLSQNPYMPTTDAQFSVRENLEICHFKFQSGKFQDSFPFVSTQKKSFPLAHIDSPKNHFPKNYLRKEK